MAKRKQNVKITKIDQDAIVFYADGRVMADIRRIEGIGTVMDLNGAAHIAYTDARYDANEIAAEIESLNTETPIPDAFTASDA